MWQNDKEIVVAKNGEIYFAPVGTPLPAKPGDKLNAAFVGAGYTTEDGASITVSPDLMEVKSWQSRQATRRDLNAQDVTIAFALQQFNEENIAFALGGGDVSEPSEGIFRYDFLADEANLDERALVIDAVDGDEHHRFVFPRGNVTESVEIQFSRGSEAKLPVTFKVLAPSDGSSIGYFLTDSPAFTPGS